MAKLKSIADQLNESTEVSGKNWMQSSDNGAFICLKENAPEVIGKVYVSTKGICSIVVQGAGQEFKMGGTKCNTMEEIESTINKLSASLIFGL